MQPGPDALQDRGDGNAVVGTFGSVERFGLSWRLKAFLDAIQAGHPAPNFD